MIRAIFIATLLYTLPLHATENTTVFTLNNGMEVLVIEDHRAPVVTHMVWYKIGAADEAPGKSGIAHFFEHLMFKGTEKHAAGVFSERVAAHGGNENAFTSWDYTAYYQSVTENKLEMVMEMEADRMRNLVLTDEVISPERNVILEERAQRVDSDPSALLGEQMQAALYLNHPYRIPIIGWAHEIAALNRSDALEFYQNYYAPNNAILIVAGDVSPENVRTLAQKYYGVIPPSAAIKPRLRPQEPPHNAARRVVMKDPRVAQPYVIRQYNAPARKPGAQKDAATLIFLAELLGGSGQSSILAQKLQFGSDPMAVYTSAFYNALALDSSNIGFVIVPTPDKTLDEAEAAFDLIIKDFIKNGPDATDFERIKGQIKADQVYAKDSATGLARSYGTALTTGLTLNDVDAWPEVLQSVTIADVQHIARTVLKRENAVTGHLRQAEAAE